MATIIAAAHVSRGVDGDGALGSSAAAGMSPTITAGLSAVEAEELRIRAALEESLRPRVSKLYGVHVTLAERTARLQCLAVLSLVAQGEDEAEDGGGSGSGGEATMSRWDNWSRCSARRPNSSPIG